MKPNRPGPRWGIALILAILAGAWGHRAQAQFNPEGRRKPKPQQVRPRSPGPAAPTQAPSSEALIARYQAIVLSQPGARFPLQRLAQLYRERDGNIDGLVAFLKQKAEAPGSDRYSAQVGLAGAYREAGELEQARLAYADALRQRPDDGPTLLALGQLEKDAGNKAKARGLLERALPNLPDAEKEQTLRELMGLALDAPDVSAAQGYHRALVKRAKGSFFVEAELGRELMLRDMFEAATQEYERVVKLAAGDNRVLAPALRDLGNAYAHLGKQELALKHLKRALALSTSASGVRRDIYRTIVEVHRRQESLPKLVEELERGGAYDSERSRVLGGLYEETGRVDDALKAYRSVLRDSPKDVSLRLRIVRLLQIQGELDEVIREYEALIRAAPDNPDFAFQLAEALIQRGERDKALAQIAGLERRAGRDEDTLVAIADFYERVGESERALTALKRLTEMGVRDPQHLVELGSRYWRDGDQERAKQVWLRIKNLAGDRAQSLFRLGEVYLEHDLTSEGLSLLREAMRLKPEDAKYKRGYALALERAGATASKGSIRAGHYEAALVTWQELLEQAGGDRRLAQEARQHIVTLWALSGQLAGRIRPLELALAQRPPNLQAGRLLAEAQMRQRNDAAAEKALRSVIRAAPGDVDSLSALERVLTRLGRQAEAIAVLKLLVKAEPNRAREYYQTMAKHAAELYQDDDAIRYAEQAVRLSPEDATGHMKLGEMYRRRQDTDRAIAAFRQALTHNDRLFAVHLDLAQLLLGQDRLKEADQHLRRVMRASPDDEMVSQAARMSMQVNLGQGTLRSLEDELLGVALGNPQRPLYRGLLVELYGAMAFPLVHQASAADPEEGEAARQELKRIGERAVKPLLDALLDERENQRRIAIELLGHIDNRGAGPALLAFAEKDESGELGTRAVFAAGALEDPALLDRFKAQWVLKRGVQASTSHATRLALVWSIAKLRVPAAGAMLEGLLSSDDAEVRALAAIGLGVSGYRRSAERLRQTALAADVGPLPRAAACFALGALGDKSARDTLAELSRAADPLLRAHAVLAMARLGLDAALIAIPEGLLVRDADERRVAEAAALVFTTGRFELEQSPLQVFRQRSSVEATLWQAVPTDYTPSAYAQALVRFKEPLLKTALGAASSSPDDALVLSEALLARQGKPAFGAFTRDLAQVPEPVRASAEAAAASIADSVVEAFAMLSEHPNLKLRLECLRFLAYRSEDSALRVVHKALSTDDALLSRGALAAVSSARNLAHVKPVLALLSGASDWSVRAQAAETLGDLLATQGAASSVPGSKAARDTLAALAKGDDYALVRQTCLEALAKLGPSGADAALRFALEHDPEPRVRERARQLLSQ